MTGSQTQRAADTQRRLLVAIAMCVVVFLVATVAAAVGYASWMWWFVFAGLVFSPLAGAVLLVVLLWNRRAASRDA